MAILDKASCRVHGARQAGNDAHRFVLGEVVQAFDNPRAVVLCEPGLTSHTMNPPDVVLVDSEAGVHVIEVKGVGLDKIRDVHAGGEVEIEYPTGPARKAVIAQARKAMFAIKGALQMQDIHDLAINFSYWVVFPRIKRSEWRWTFKPPELLFNEDCESFAKLFGDKGRQWLNKQGLDFWSDQELSQVLTAFGDNAVIMPGEGRRPPRPAVTTGTLGEAFDSAATAYRSLSGEQQTLAEEVWEEGPRLVRGVAGSGKTVVLAANLARRLERIEPSIPGLVVGNNSRPRIGALCFNRTLVPFLLDKIEAAFRQRTGRALGNASTLRVSHLNALYWDYSRLTPPPWSYLSIEKTKELVGDEDDRQVTATRAAHFLGEWRAFAAAQPRLADAVRFDTLYVDEGQDLHPDEITLLGELCKRGPTGEPNLIIFYDDAQNLYARPRPTWKDCGLNVAGSRAKLMLECHRNPRAIVESAFNVLYGAFAPSGSKKPTKEFGDIPTLEAKGLIEHKNGLWHVRFAKRSSANKPKVTVSESWESEKQGIVARIRWMLREEQVRPQDILVLAQKVGRVGELVRALEGAGLTGVKVHNATAQENKDSLLNAPGGMALSTVHSAKGYDAYVVLIAAANDFHDAVEDRATFYVGCTRALEWLEIFAHEKAGLVVEMEKAVAALA
jgi:hypothetical protein